MEILSEKIPQKDLLKGLDIYNYFIVNSKSNFEEKKLSRDYFLKFYKKLIINKMPFLIAKQESHILGIAFVSKFREKSGYRYTFEHSIYVNPKFLKKGYGTKILKELIKQCKKNKNIKNLIAVIGGSDNIGSIKIHKKNGFKYIGTLKRIGYKKNRWIDSVYMQKTL